VEVAVDAVQTANPLPLVVAGVERNLAFYRAVTRQAAAIIGMLTGNLEQTLSQEKEPEYQWTPPPW
jgi:hypothetical protein